MANTKFEYVKTFEAATDAPLLPGCWIVVRIDGRGFTKFCEKHDFEKPSDHRALGLMNDAACAVMEEFGDIRLAYGESDEYSFVLHKDTKLYGRRASKITSLVVSCFASAFVMGWPARFPGVQLAATPMFDARAVLYPSDTALRDYLAWRQADTHINTQYNTVFWALVRDGATKEEAQAALKGTVTAQKNEILFSRFGINYNELPEIERKGTVIVRVREPVVVKMHPQTGEPVVRERARLVPRHDDIIGDAFWQEHPHVLAP
ncbi:unnamed protein product [Pedinophyceae sp. YPF-701]|nr:unnamed protein product [Pedinophyceae sp. YPF-701]